MGLNHFLSHSFQFLLPRQIWNCSVVCYVCPTSEQELNRAEAMGIPQVQIIATEWHTLFRLPSKITEPNRITEYTCDTQGRQPSSSVHGKQ